MAGVIFLEQDNLRFTQLTKDRLNESVQIGKTSFFADETVCNAIGLKYNQVAIDELTELFIKVAQDGVSVIAIDTKTDSVVAVSFNKIHVRNQPDIQYYESFADRCTDLASKAFLSFMVGTDLVIDMFEFGREDCYLEIMFLGVQSDYRGKSIAYNLCRTSEYIAQTLLSGTNIKQSTNENCLQLEPVPKFISAIFTSPVSQKLGKKLKMEVATTVSLDRWSYKGQTFAKRLGNKTAPIEYHYKLLNRK